MYDSDDYSPHDIAPRDSDSCIIADIVRSHLAKFLERVSCDTDGQTIPVFVQRELKALSGCGDFAQGFLRLRCGDCRADRIVPLRCKSRLCPSCAARRMSDTSAWLVDRVLQPTIGYRQFVLTFPASLAVGLCFREDPASAVIRLCMRVLFEYLRARSADDPNSTPHPGGIVWIQRFSDGGGAWLHLHVLLPDGVFRAPKYALGATFEPHPPPTQAEVDTLAKTLARRITRLIAMHSSTAPDDALLERCAAQPVKAVRVPTPAPSHGKRPTLLGECDGFQVHAATSVPPNSIDQLERMLRHVGRPALPCGRIDRRIDGTVVFKLKRPRRGVTEFLFEPLAFLARISALIPRPMSNQIRYFGIDSPASSLREYILPVPPDATPTRPVAPERPKRMGWADLLQRVFLTDILECPCGGRLRIIAILTKPDVVAAVAAAIILSHQQPARAPPTRTASQSR